MQLRSLGLRSDLLLIDGEVLDRGDYLVVRSPAEPGYYWGNLLVFERAPGQDDFARWEACFAREFEDTPAVKHRTFTWDTTDEKPDPVEAFKAAGYRREVTVVLTASRVVAPPHPTPGLDVRRITSDAQWDDVIECQIACREPELSEEAYREFIRRRLGALRRRIEHGAGDWYGAYVDDQHVGNLGVLRIDGLARFQHVCTSPHARRRGVCGTLVHAAALSSLDHPDVGSLVMLADAEYHAARIYQSVGFEPTEQLQGLCRYPETPPGPPVDPTTTTT